MFILSHNDPGWIAAGIAIGIGIGIALVRLFGRAWR